MTCSLGWRQTVQTVKKLVKILHICFLVNTLHVFCLLCILLTLTVDSCLWRAGQTWMNERSFTVPLWIYYCFCFAKGQFVVGNFCLFVCFMKKKVTCTTSFNSCYVQQVYYRWVNSGENNQEKRNKCGPPFVSIWDWCKFILSDKVFRQEGRIATNKGILFLKSTCGTTYLHHVNF